MKMAEPIILIALGAASPCLAQGPADVSHITAANTLEAEDEREMRAVVVRLNHALDAADYELYASYFSEDAEFVSDFGTANGRAEIASALERSRPLITGKRHIAANFLFTGGGRTATVTTYLVVFERESATSFVGSAVNTDTFERRNGEWILVRHDSELDRATANAMRIAMGSNRDN